MAHYAFLDDNNIVTHVITGRNEDEVVDGISNWEEYYGDFYSQACKRTSYNNRIRKNYAGIGMRYDEILDAFIPIQPYPSWTLNENTCKWEASIEMPQDGSFYVWNENILEWQKVE